MSVPVFNLKTENATKIIVVGLALCAFSATALAADGKKTAKPASSENTSKINTGEITESAALTFFDIQVFSPHLSIYDEATENSVVIADIKRGQLLRADKRQGDWYRIPASGSYASSYGWIKQGAGEDGDLRFSVQPVLVNAVTSPDGSNAGIAAEAIASSGTQDIQRASVGSRRIEITIPVIDPNQVPAPQASLPQEMIPVPDRWRIMQALGFRFPFYDPYHQNPLKGDLPVLPSLGHDWFFNLGLISDSTIEMRRLPIPVAPQTSAQPGALNVFGDDGKQSTFIETLIINLGLIKGDTTFKPPEYEFRFVPVLNYNRSEVNEPRALRVDPRSGEQRNDNFIGIQELFADVHLRNVSERYDFDSVRIGIQPMNLDFRGFLFQDNALGLRLFGNRDNNHWQYNAGWMRRIEKDTNSGLNDLSQSLRRDDVYFANLYRQDFPVAGFTSQLTLAHNRNNESAENYYDNNGFQVRPAVIGDVRPHNYQVTYLGYSGDGHFGRYSLTTSSYLGLGHDQYNAVAQKSQKIEAFFHASELSRDFDWIRLRGNFLYASGDKDPFDNISSGFDAIQENPQFAGADTSFFIRQAVPLIGGGGVALSGRNGVLPSLRSSKDQGQSNFVNPGLTLFGLGADIDVTPTLRVLSNVSALRFNETEILGVLRNQLPPAKDIGTDISAGLQYRPLYSQNIVITSSVAALLPGKGLRELYDEDQRGPQYSALLNVILAF